MAEFEKLIGRTKAQVLRKIESLRRCRFDVAAKIASADLIAFRASAAGHAADTPSLPDRTCRQSLPSHGRMWGYPLDQQAIKDAFTVAKRMGITTKSASRDRRPTRSRT